MFRRSFVPMLAALALLLAACQGGGASTSPGASPGGGGSKTVGLALSTLNNPFFVTLRDGAQAKAQELGLTLEVADGQDDLAKQVSQVEDFITKKVAVIIINPVDSDGIVPAVQKANSANIPVITVDRAANGGTVASHIASDNVAGAKAACDELIKRVGSGNIVQLEGIAGTSAARDRGKGCKDAIDAQSAVKLVASQTADFARDKGLNVMQNLLQANPDVKGVFAQNDEMALGAVQAVAAAGKANQITVVGFDAIDDALAAIKDGKMAATIAQQPKLMGETAMATAKDIIDGKTVQASQPVEVKLVTKDNVADFMK
jgi:ribose transport system substrate-binding protein